ncbi:MAG: DEAD/DEAH box helicase family protein [Fusobacterium necrophorum]|nr:DEAD/DEAH box helicase family protein [Fusobacterium necrophorum]
MDLNAILNQIDENSVSTRDKGTKFEVLIKHWFLSTPLYCNELKEVWLWNEFPYKSQFGGSDSGIDLVLLTHDGDYTAVQCKFYSLNSSIDKGDVDTFISTSAKVFDVDGASIKFTRRIFVSTTNKWTKKANELIENQEIPVTRISLSILEDSGVDWNKLYQGNFGEKARKEKKKIRDHQNNALRNVNSHFKENNRGKLIMACGTGKTFTSLKIAENEVN